MGNTNGRQSGPGSPRRLSASAASGHGAQHAHVRTFDGGSLAPHGIYPGKPDYNPVHVHKYIRERRLAPFYKGLDDYEDQWTDYQLANFVRDGKLPAAPEPPPIMSPVNSVTPSPAASPRLPSNSSTPSLVLPPSVDELRPGSPRSRGMSVVETHSQHQGPADSSSNLSVSSRDKRSRPRAQTTGSSNLIPTRGKPLEVVVYRGAIECPVCFLFYPPNINRTRCCWKPVCTECFVEMKRAEPHYPSTDDQAPTNTTPPGVPPTPTPALNLNPMNLISDPVRCPFCVKSDFGVVYNPPIWLPTDRKPDGPPREIATSPLQSTDHLPLDKREEMYPPGHESVVLSDNIRPDWYQHLAHRRRVEARRLATATALQQALAVAGQRRRGSSSRTGVANAANAGGTAEPRRMIGRRVDGIVRITRDEADEMMLQEAIRQSLVSQEEERNKRDEEERKKAGSDASQRSSESSAARIIVPPGSTPEEPSQISPVSFHLPRLQPSTSTSPPASRSFFSAFRSRSGSASSRNSISPPTPQTPQPQNRRPSSASNLHPPTPVVRRQPSLPEPLLSPTTSANLQAAMHDSIVPDDSRPSISSPLATNAVEGDSSTPPAGSVSTASTANEEILPVEEVRVPSDSTNGMGLKTRGESGSVEEHEVVQVANA